MQAYDHTTYKLVGSGNFTLANLAKDIAEISGKAVAYQNLNTEDYSQALLQAGLAAGLVDVIVDANIQTEKGTMFSKSKDLENIMSHKAHPLKIK
ncbi:hypothetical protein [Acinetobacter sp. ANC 4779]|uniref:hypothetical protein n=1 Tax=Acinetobacter sp. ANC 4779 TaxID=2529848 RepID=UPI001D19754B|nr:hypothetical protein [Acinetobacter sp. ANC 4779]